MASSLFNHQIQTNQPNLLNLAKTIINNNPEALFQQMYNSNSQFKQFVDENKGLSDREIAQKYGIPL